MPELSSEKPSCEELQSYLNEHLRETRKMFDHYHEKFGVDFQKLYKKTYDSILKSLYCLNDFSREDKFWHNTNKKPTIFKLDEFRKLKLEENADNISALWTTISLAIVYGQTEHGFSEIVEKLFEFGELEKDILIKIYLFEDMFYEGDGESLAERIKTLEIEKECRIELEQLEKLENEFVSNWAKKVLSKIKIQ